jgi:hypothetical protein
MDRCARARTSSSCGTSEGVNARPDRSADGAPDAEHGGEHEERPNAVGAFQRDRE